MALSKSARARLESAITRRKEAKEIADAIDSGSNPQAANVAALGTTVDLPASAAVLSTTDTYADADVKAAIDGAVDALGAAAEDRLDDIEAKLDAILTSLKAAGVMASS